MVLQITATCAYPFLVRASARQPFPALLHVPLAPSQNRFPVADSSHSLPPSLSERRLPSGRPKIQPFLDKGDRSRATSKTHFKFNTGRFDVSLGTTCKQECKMEGDVGLRER
jgi:hypothetical protein